MAWRGGFGASQQSSMPPWAKKPQAQQPGLSQATLSAQVRAAAVTEAAAAREKANAAAAVNAEAMKTKVAKLSTDLACTETVTTTTVETSTIVLENDKATVSSCKSSVESLERQQKKLMEMQQQMTKDWAEAKKAGPAGTDSATEIGKLRTKCNELCKSVTVQINKLKPKMTKIQAEVDLKAKETADSNTFRPVLAKLKTAVNAVEIAVNSVSRQATALLTKPPEDAEAKDKKITTIEEAATEAAKKTDAAKKDVSEQYKVISAFAPDAKKTAQEGLTELTKKLSEFTKTASTYKAFKKDFPKLVINQKAVAEATEKLNGHDSRIKSAEQISKATKLSMKQCSTINENFEPVTTAISEAQQIMQKTRQPDLATQAKFTELRQKISELKKKMEEVIAKIKPQRDALMAEQAVDDAKEKLEKLAGCWKACQEAEMPFLTGVEVLADDISDKTLKTCAEACQEATSVLTETKSYLGKKIAECKTYEKELMTKTNEELVEVRTEVAEVEGKLTRYRKELADRKVAAIMDAALEVVESFQKKVKAAESAAKLLSSADVEDEEAENIKEAIKKTQEAMVEAATSSAEAKTLVAKKTAEAKVGKGNPQVQKIDETLNGAQTRLGKLRTTVLTAEKLVKTLAAVKTGEEKVKEGEDLAAKVEALAPKAGKAMTTDGVKALDEACAKAIASIKGALPLLQQNVAGAPPNAKKALQELLERRKEAQESVDKVKTEAKEAREDCLCANYLEEAESKTKAAEEASSKMEESEAPFLIGGNMELKSTLELIEKCVAASKLVGTAVAAAKAYPSQKANEVAKFGKENATKAKEGFAACAERLKKVSEQQARFEKDTKNRTKDARMAEASEKMQELEDMVKKVVAAAEPFKKEGDQKLGEKAAQVPLKAFAEVDKDARAKAAAAQSFFAQRSNEQQGNSENMATLKALKERLTKANTELAVAKKATAPYETIANAMQMLEEAKEQAAGLEGAVKTAKESAAALVDSAGEALLVATSMQVLAGALLEHIKEENLTEEKYFKSINKGKAVPEKEFAKYLKELPRVIGHDEISAFSDARITQIYKKLAGEAKGVSLDGFKGIFPQPYYCVRPISYTEKFEVEEETLGKVAPGEEVEIFGLPMEDDSGCVRSQCKVGDKTGWITIKPNKGNANLTLISPFRRFDTKMTKAVAESYAIVNKASSSVSAKLTKCPSASEGTLKEVKDELVKLKDEVVVHMKAMEEIKKAIAKARGPYAAKEKEEREAHIEARNNKEAAPFLEEPKSKMEVLEAEAAAVEEAAAPLASLSSEELLAFASPGPVLEKVEKLAASVAEKAKEARESIKEQLKKVSETSPKTGGTALAKNQLAIFTPKVEELFRKATGKASVVKSKSNQVVQSKIEPTVAAIRKRIAAKKKTASAFYDTLKKGDKIPEDAFVKFIVSLEGLSVSQDLAKLITRKIETEGISKETFLKRVVIYYKITKGIAFTDDQDVTKCSTVRKADEGEVVEVLDGPITLEDTGMTRIKCKSFSNSDGAEGWITVSGSKGTTFCEKCAKPEPKPEAKPKGKE